MKLEKNDDLDMKQSQIDDDHVMKPKDGQVYYDVYTLNIKYLKICNWNVLKQKFVVLCFFQIIVVFQIDI